MSSLQSLPPELRLLIYDYIIIICNQEFNPSFILNLRRVCKSFHVELANVFTKLTWDITLRNKEGKWSLRKFRDRLQFLDKQSLKESIGSVYLNFEDCGFRRFERDLKRSFWPVILGLPHVTTYHCKTPDGRIDLSKLECKASTGWLVVDQWLIKEGEETLYPLPDCDVYLFSGERKVMVHLVI